ncbi:MAG: transcriptional repressor [Ruminococcus sp.]|jgi:Fur family ferric uptake transcriptional regulator
MNHEGDIQKMESQKRVILDKMREKGCRITKQRMMILDVILSRECSSCKEICYYVARKDNSIGQATVYRMLNVLEDVGVISRKNMYRVDPVKKSSLDGNDKVYQ